LEELDKMTIYCKGHCVDPESKYEPKKLVRDAGNKGYKRCSKCCIYIKYVGTRCPCCAVMLKISPRNSKARQQLRERKEVARY